MPTESDVQKILDGALLENPDREQDYEVSLEWLDEIRRRCEKIDSGEIEPVDGEIAMRVLRD